MTSVRQIYRMVDDLLDNGTCDEYMRSVDLSGMTSYELVGLMCATYASRAVLPSRDEMIARIMAEIAPSRVDHMMATTG